MIVLKGSDQQPRRLEDLCDGELSAVMAQAYADRNFSLYSETMRVREQKRAAQE